MPMADGGGHAYATGSFTSKVQSALSEIAELKAKYNISSSRSPSGEYRRSQRDSRNPPHRAQNRNADVARTEPTTSNSEGKLHDTLHDALAEIARIQSKYNVNSTATTQRTNSKPEPQQTRDPSAGQTRPRGTGRVNADAYQPALSLQESNTHRPAAAQAYVDGENGRETSGSATTTRPLPHQSSRSTAPQFSLSERLSALSMSDLEGGRKSQRNGPSAEVLAELDKERAQRKKLEVLLRRSANEIRTLQEHVSSLEQDEAAVSEAKTAAGVSTVQDLRDWVIDCVQRFQPMIENFEVKCDNLETLLHEKNAQINEQRREIEKLRRSEASAKMECAAVKSASQRLQQVHDESSRRRAQQQQQQPRPREPNFSERTRSSNGDDFSGEESLPPPGAFSSRSGAHVNKPTSISQVSSLSCQCFFPVVDERRAHVFNESVLREPGFPPVRRLPQTCVVYERGQQSVLLCTRRRVARQL